MNGVTPDDALAQTRRWLERFVIGLNLCPFAAAPYRQGRIAYAVSDADALEAVYQAFLEALQGLVDADPTERETTLLILTRGLRPFDAYLEALALCEQAIVEAGLEGRIQVASFHPDYVFADAPDGDPANFTNRSPYPMFHLIREDGLAAALEAYPDPAQIPARNIRRLRALGLAGIRRLIGDGSAGQY
jgi:hypothetical protein